MTWYAGHEPTEPPFTRAEELAYDDWDAHLRRRRWLARRDYLDRKPRDRGWRRHVARLAPTRRHHSHRGCPRGLCPYCDKARQLDLRRHREADAVDREALQ